MPKSLALTGAGRKARDDAICHAYEAGASLRDLGERFGLTQPRIAQILRDNRVDVRPAIRIRKPMFEIVLARADNELLRDIAAREGCTAPSISDRLKRIGATEKNVKAIKRLKPHQLEAYRAALDDFRLPHADALELAREETLP